MQVACSLSTKPDMVPTDILVSFPFYPLLGTLICMFLYIYVSSVHHCHSLLPHVPLSYRVSSGRLVCTAFLFLLPAPLHPSICPLPLQTIAPPQFQADRNGGATVPTVRGAFCHASVYPSVKWSLSS